MEWPEVTIVICTYDRPREIRSTIDSLIQNLKYPTEKLRFHIADDGSPEGYVEDLRKWLKNSWHENPQFAAMPFTYSITPRLGWGSNVNESTRHVKSDYTYFTEDDYVLKRELDLCPYVAAMEVAPSIGLMRFGIAGHEITCHLNEVDIRKWLPDYQEAGENGAGYTSDGRLNIWVIDKQYVGGRYSFYHYSNRPHLKHRRFHEAYGLYPEGLTLGNTEHGMNHQYQQGTPQPYIACPANWTLWHYDHIGVSRQNTDLDPGERNR